MRRFIFLYLLFFLLQTSCSSKESSREHIEKVRSSSKHSAAADYMDGFWLDHRSPEDKESQHWEFYYKHCTNDGRKPYPDKAEWMCTEPY